MNHPSGFVLLQQTRGVTFGVVDISKNPGFGRAGDDTGGQITPQPPMLAKVAFVDDFLLRVTVAGTIGTGRDAASATDSQFVVD